MLRENLLENLNGKVVYVDGVDIERKKIVQNIYLSYGVSVISTVESEIDIYCLISPIEGNYSNVTCGNVDLKKSETIINKMVEKKSGIFILITNSMGNDHIVSSRWAREEATQAGIIQWWKSISTKAAQSGVRGNIISLGYAPFWEKKLDKEYQDKLLEKLSIKRFATEDDLKYALYYLSTSESSYVVGEVLNIDGGLHRRSIINIKGNEELLSSNGFHLENKRVLIIGASSGMGKVIAKKIAMRGAFVILSSRNVNALTEIKQQIENDGGLAEIHRLDVTNKKNCKTVMDAIYEENNHLDGIIYATGCYEVEKFYKSNLVWNKVVDTNFNGLVEISNLYINKCIEFSKKGVIVAITSVATDTVPVANSEAYIASKAAMRHFIESLSLSYARNGIRMNCVAPGCTDTPMINQVSEDYRKMWLECIPNGRLGTPEDVAGTVGFLISDASSYINGETVKVDGGFSLGNLAFFEKDMNYE